MKHVSLSFTLTHPEPYDVNILLTTPGTTPERKVEFMAGLGPVQQPFENPPPGGVYSYGVSNVVLTFDDGADAAAPTIFPLFAGTYKPTVTTPIVAFPAPAPALPYATNLSAFSEYTQPAAGSWRLFVNDIARGDLARRHK